MEKGPNVQKLILSQLVKDSMGERQLSHLRGALYYCHFGEENRDANETQKKCSCACNPGEDYYGIYGINAEAKFTYYWDTPENV